MAYDPITHTYVHPQSQIVDDDADEPTGKPFVKTSAPPVACEYAPAKVLHSDMAEQSDNEASQEPVPTPWLTPESVRSDLSRIQQEQLSV
ncbi:MAG: hypothetical protein HC936_14875 [Leptolyngbyaceae cyanobacterium SU_3_3]|nr:hypothetical protein [Leptolyngbyaceae cyanobacterium SU_3_3]